MWEQSNATIQRRKKVSHILMDPYQKLEEQIFRDLGGRGLAKLWTPGSLKEAATRILATDHDDLGLILTGFCCMHERCETDGPIGSSILCNTLRALGFNVKIITDSNAYPVVNAAAGGLPVITQVPAEKISFVVSIERPGRSAKTRDYRTMRARDISSVTAPLDIALLPTLDGEGKKPYLTVAIGDGGNEAGTGNIKELVIDNIPEGPSICTDVVCDNLIMAGVSNWGGIALAGALILASMDTKAKDVFLESCGNQEAMMDAMLKAGSYDGVSGEQVPKVDGMWLNAENKEVTQGICEVVRSFV